MTAIVNLTGKEKYGSVLKQTGKHRFSVLADGKIGEVTLVDKPELNVKEGKIPFTDGSNIKYPVQITEKMIYFSNGMAGYWSYENTPSIKNWMPLNVFIDDEKESNDDEEKISTNDSETVLKENDCNTTEAPIEDEKVDESIVEENLPIIDNEKVETIIVEKDLPTIEDKTLDIQETEGKAIEDDKEETSEIDIQETEGKAIEDDKEETSEIETSGQGIDEE